MHELATATRARSRGRLACVLGVVALLAAACSSSSKSGAPSASNAVTTTTVNLAALGTPKKATGTPVLVGTIVDSGGSGTLNAQSDLSETGVKLAVDYANDYLGGLAGHPIQLVVCQNQGTPAGATDCANQMVQKKVAAVVWPFTGQGSPVPILTAAKIPVVETSGTSQAELTTPGVFSITGGFPGVLGAFAQYAKEHGVKKFAMLTIDVPEATQGATALGGIVFKNAGVGFQVVPVAPGTPDMSPQLQAAVSGGADAVGVTGDITFCTSFLKAYDTLALTVPKYVIAVCNDQAVIKALPTALKGAVTATTTGKDSDNALYAAIVTKYGAGQNIDPDATKSAGVAAGVGAMIDFVRGAAGLTGEPTAASVLAQYKKAQGTIFLSGGLKFNCNGTAIPLLPNICSAQFQMAVLNADGTVQSASSVDASGLFK